MLKSIFACVFECFQCPSGVSRWGRVCAMKREWNGVRDENEYERKGLMRKRKPYGEKTTEKTKTREREST